jgi:hypothetical protein
MSTDITVPNKLENIETDTEPLPYLENLRVEITVIVFLVACFTLIGKAKITFWGSVIQFYRFLTGSQINVNNQSHLSGIFNTYVLWTTKRNTHQTSCSTQWAPITCQLNGN